MIQVLHNIRRKRSLAGIAKLIAIFGLLIGIALVLAACSCLPGGAYCPPSYPTA